MSTAPEASTNSASKAAELRQDLTQALASADTAATETVRNLQLVQQARLSQLTRAAANLKRQHGAGDAGAQAAQAAVQAATSRIARIAAIQQQAATPDPQVSSSGWALHGRVFSSAGDAVPQLTVFLVDAQKTFQRQFGFAYSDDTGYFLINYPGEPQQTEKTAAATGSQTAPELYVEVSNNKKQPLFLSTVPFTPPVGRSHYQDIYLAAGDQAIGHPPGTVRGVAMPPGTQKH